MSDVNVDLLRRTLQYIEEHPECWDQRVWISEDGEKLCFVGTAVYLEDPDALEWEFEEDTFYGYVRVGSRAERVLGLTQGQVERLAAPTLSLDEIRALVAEFCGDA